MISKKKKANFLFCSPVPANGTEANHKDVT